MTVPEVAVNQNTSYQFSPLLKLGRIGLCPVMVRSAHYHLLIVLQIPFLSRKMYDVCTHSWLCGHWHNSLVDNNKGCFIYEWGKLPVFPEAPVPGLAVEGRFPQQVGRRLCPVVNLVELAHASQH